MALVCSLIPHSQRENAREKDNKLSNLSIWKCAQAPIGPGIINYIMIAIYVKQLNCHIGTTIYFWVFGFPYTYIRIVINI